MRVGIIGCGNISETYFECQNLFNNFTIVACADINIEAAKNRAEKYNVKAFSVEDILANEDIDVIINLTIPSAHKEIIMKSLKAGKHCFSEKPLAMNFNEGLEISKLASSKNLYVGCAPDTFLGAAGQKARSLIEDKKIGDVVLGTFNLMSHGMEHWHPNPDFFFKPGARNGEKIKVETPTTLMGTLEFHNNAKIQFFCSWDVWKHKHSTIELYGLEGSMIVPDPNFFSGDILISHKEEDWQVINNDKMLLGIPNKTDNNGDKIANYRGIGLSDMINAISNKRQSRCSLDLAVHVLEAMEGIIQSSDERVIYNMKTKPNQPAFLDDSEVVKLKK